MSETWQDVYWEPEPSYRHEFPVAGRTWVLENKDKIPENETAALMEAAPNEPIRESWEQIQARHEAVVERIEQIMLDRNFTDEERAVFEICVLAGHSVRIAEELIGIPKSTIHRIKTSILQILKEELS